jgi:hypothetical protein
MCIKLIVLVVSQPKGEKTQIDGVREQDLRIWAKESRSSGIVEIAT